MPFMDLTPITTPTDTNTVGEEHPEDSESIDWNVAERYINNLGDKDNDE